MADGSWRPRQISCRLCREPRTDRDADDDRAQRLISGADQESHVRVDLTAVVIAVREGVPYILTVERSAQPKFSLPSGPLEPGHHSLQSGLRSWVERQTHHPLGYVEQLYTFGDRATAQLDSTVTSQQRAISIAYLALEIGRASCRERVCQSV